MATSLPDSVLFCFDDFDETNVYPEDYYEWCQRGKNLLELDCPGMKAAVEDEIRRGTTLHIVLDYPFGRDHPRFCDHIDPLVFIDIALDVAMARRILRDHAPDSKRSPEERLKELRTELDHYLRKGRHIYLTTYAREATSDLILDGWKSPEAIRDEILAAITPAGPQGRNHD